MDCYILLSTIESKGCISIYLSIYLSIYIYIERERDRERDRERKRQRETEGDRERELKLKLFVALNGGLHSLKNATWNSILCVVGVLDFPLGQ